MCIRDRYRALGRASASDARGATSSLNWNHKCAWLPGNNDPEIGEILADALLKVGKDGVITVDEGRNVNTEVDLVEGMQFDRGYLSPYFVPASERMEVVLEDPYIIIHEKKISSLREFMKLLEKLGNTRKPSLGIAEDVEGEALAARLLALARRTY